MSFSLDLLEQADHLIKREKKRPKQASLRRSVSNAYYSLFHLLTYESASLVAGRLEPAYKVVVQRWFEHGSMYNACAVFDAESFSGAIVKLAGPTPLPDLQLIARAFRELQQARHSADYDMASAWSRPKAQQNVQLAQRCVQRLGTSSEGTSSNCFRFGPPGPQEGPNRAPIRSR